MVQYQLPYIVALLGITSLPVSVISSEKNYPSEYAYRDDSVTRTESITVTCRNYPPGPQQQELYIYCSGIQLKLTDGDLGPEQFMVSSSSHYQWSAGSGEQLLFIFPTRVSLTTITLHHYSISGQGLPKLTFFAVPDDFDVWNAPRTAYPHVVVASVPPDGESAGRRSISITINLNTQKVLMHKDSSNFMFIVSEVEFFTCVSSTIPVTTYTTTATAVSSHMTSIELINSTSDNTTTNQDAETSTSQGTTLGSPQTQDTVQPTVMVALGVVGALLLILIISLIIILPLILRHHKRGVHKSETDPNSDSMREDTSYSTLERGTRQQIQPQCLNSTELYDQIHLSPSTGQTEMIPKTEEDSIPPSNVYSSIDMENSETKTGSKPEDATYAIVDKKKKRKKSKGESDNGTNNDDSKLKKEEGKVKGQQSLEDMYAVVYKKPKKSGEQEETPPPIPAPTVESLYTAVQNKPQQT